MGSHDEISEGGWFLVSVRNASGKVLDQLQFVIPAEQKKPIE